MSWDSQPKPSLTCPVCGSELGVVTETRRYPEYIRRRRQCDLGHRFTTHETVWPDGAVTGGLPPGWIREMYEAIERLEKLGDG